MANKLLIYGTFIMRTVTVSTLYFVKFDTNGYYLITVKLNLPALPSKKVVIT